MYLSELSKDRNNNLDVMRFIAAILVIVSHSIPLSMGEEYTDIISRYTDGMLSLGAISVGVFFVAGGFLISKSMERTKTAGTFFISRCIRIFPPLIFLVFITVFIMGPVITSLTWAEYFTDKNTYLYLLNMLLIPVHNLPGVFEENVYQYAVNGPLWTLPVEFICYVLCFIAYKMKLFQKKNFMFTLPMAAAVCLALIYLDNGFILSVIRPVLLFYIGFGLYVFRDRIKLTARYFWAAVLAFAVLIVMKCDFMAMILVFPYIIFYLAFGCKYKISNFGKYGEFSYGIYLWGWPVGQIICMLHGGTMNWFLNAAEVSVIAILLGIVSYYVVDRNVISYRKKIRLRKQSE